jgi:hypothetical protein
MVLLSFKFFGYINKKEEFKFFISEKAVSSLMCIIIAFNDERRMVNDRETPPGHPFSGDGFTRHLENGRSPCELII